MKYITPIIVLFISIAGAGLAHAEYERSEVGSLRLNNVANATVSATVGRESEQEDGDDNEGDIETKTGQVMNQVSKDGERDTRDQMKEIEKNNKDKKDLRDDNDEDEQGDDNRSATGTEMKFHADDLENLDQAARQGLVTQAAAITTVVTDADLKLVTQAALIKDPNIVKIGIADDHVTMDYRQPAKLFGFIPIKLLVSSSIDSNGKVTFTYPWLAKLSKTNKGTLDAAVLAQDSIAEVSDPNQLKLQMMLDKKAKLEEMLSNLMKKVSETTDTVTANLK